MTEFRRYGFTDFVKYRSYM